MDEENVRDDGPSNPTYLSWILPLGLLVVLVIFGAWFCRTEPPKPEAPKPANVNTANANSVNVNTANANSANVNTANANSANGNSTAVSNSGNSAPSGNSNKYR